MTQFSVLHVPLNYYLIHKYVCLLSRYFLHILSSWMIIKIMKHFELKILDLAHDTTESISRYKCIIIYTFDSNFFAYFFCYSLSQMVSPWIICISHSQPLTCLSCVNTHNIHVKYGKIYLSIDAKICGLD